MEKPSQMIWQQQLKQQHQRQQIPPRLQIKRSRKSTLPPLALKNLGNSCYLNSVLQCLTYTPPLANFALNSCHSSLCPPSDSPNCPFCILEKRIHRSLTVEHAVDSPTRIHSRLTLFSDQFRHNRQEDAHEFLRYVIDACHNACVRINKLKLKGDVSGAENTFVKEIFGGELRSQVKCTNCGGESNKMDEIMDISLDLFQISSVKDALQRFFQPEVLNGTNKYKCDSCAKLVVAKKQLSVMKAPNVLVIQLKRFEGIHGSKIDRAISFEECLVLSNFMCKESQDPHPEYKLFGTIVHSGYSPESGHYYAYIKDGLGRWYCCNDSIISLSTLQDVLSEKVYILFFIRTNQRPNPPKSSSVTNGVKPLHSNGEVPSSSRIKVGNPEEAHINGNGNSNGQVSSTSRMKYSRSSDSKENHGNGNGNGNSSNNGYGEDGTVSQTEDSAKLSGSKRKVAVAELPTVEKIDGVLEKDASSHLRSCGWYDEVYSFMLARKRLCGKGTSDVEMRKMLIEESRKKFLSEIPGSLKAHLCASLKSFHETKHSLDPPRPNPHH